MTCLLYTSINIRPGSGTDAYDGGGNGTSTGYFTRKYYNPQASGDQNSGMNIITMRYACLLYTSKGRVCTSGLKQHCRTQQTAFTSTTCVWTVR